MSESEYNVHTLKEQVTHITKRYLDDMSGFGDTGIHQTIMDTVEGSILRTVMTYTDSNQKEAAFILGISRNTLRNKLTKHDINTTKR